MIVGEAQIVVRAITDRVRKDIQAAFKSSRADMEKSGEESGKAWSKGFQSTVDADILGGIRKAMGGVEKEAAATGRRAGRNFQRGLGAELRDVGATALKGFTERIFNVANAVDLMGPAIAGLVGAVSAAASGLFAMGAAAAQALPSVAALAGSMLAMGQAMGVVKTVFNKGLSEALTGDADELAKLGEKTQAFVKDVEALKEGFADVRKEVQESFFTGFGRSIDEITKDLPMLQGHMKRTATIVGGMGRSFIETIFSGDRFSKILEGNNKTLTIFGRAIRPLADLLLKVGVALQPVTRRFAEWITSMIEAKNASTSIEGLTQTFKKAGDVAALLGDIFGNVWESIKLLGKAAAPAGESLLKSFKGATDQWVTFLSQGDNQAKLVKFFEGASDNLRSISAFIGDVVVGLAKMGDNKGIKVFFDEIRKSVDAWERMGDVLTSPAIAKAMAGLANEITKVFENLTQGDQIEVFIDTLKTAAEVINEIIDLIQKIVPDGFGAKLLAAFAIFRGTKLVAGVLGLGAAFAKLQSIVGARISTGLFGPKSPIGPNGPAQARGAASGLGFISTQANNLRGSLSAAGTSARGLGVALAGRGAGGAGPRLRAVSFAARDLGKNMRAAAGPAARLGGPMAGLAVAAGAMGDGAGQSIASMALMGSMFGPLGAAAGFTAGSITTLAKANNSFEDALKSNKSALGDSTPEYNKLKASSEALRKELNGLAKDDGFSANIKRGMVGINAAFGDNEIHQMRDQLIKSGEEMTKLEEKAKFELKALNIEPTKEQIRALVTGEMTALQIKAGEINKALATADAAQTMRNNIRGIGEALKAINPDGAKIGDLFNLDNNKANGVRNAISNTALSISNMAATINDPALKNDFLGTHRESLIKAATQAGATKGQVELLLDKLGIIGTNDPNIEFKTNALGVQQQIVGMTNITKAQFDSLPKEVRTAITTVKRGLTNVEIQNFATQLNNLDKKDIKVLLRMQGVGPKDIERIASQIANAAKVAKPPIPLKVNPVPTGFLAPFFKDVNRAKENAKTPVTVKAKFDPGNSLSDAVNLRSNLQGTFAGPIYQRVITQYSSTGSPPRAQVNAAGGRISGPGTGTSDSILSFLSNGEYVIRAAAAKAIGYSRLDRLNREGRIPAAAARLVSTSSGRGGSGSVNIHVNNPAPERASSSVGSNLRNRAVNAGWSGF